MVNTDLLPAAPQIVFLSSFFLVELLDSKSQLLEQILLSIMVFCLGGSHQSLKIFCFNLKKVLKIKKKFSIIIKTRYALRRCLTGTENRGNPARPSRRKLNSVFIIILIIITKKWRQNRSHNQRRGDGHKGYILCAYLQMVFDLREHSAKHYFCPGMPDKEQYCKLIVARARASLIHKSIIARASLSNIYCSSQNQHLSTEHG